MIESLSLTSPNKLILAIALSSSTTLNEDIPMTATLEIRVRVIPGLICAVLSQPVATSKCTDNGLLSCFER